MSIKLQPNWEEAIKKMEEQGRAGDHRVQRTRTVIRRVRHHRKAIQLKCDCVVHNCDSEQKFRIPYHTVFGFLIPLLIAVLQVSNQGTNNYSFETYSANWLAFLLAMLVYSFAIVADMKSQFYNPSYVHISSLVAVISGSLSSVLLISIFIPHLTGRLIFIIWACLSIIVSRSLIVSICCWLYQMIMKTFFQVVGIRNRFKGSSQVEQPRLPI